MTSRTLLARQPIFDTDLNIYAYELLFRGADADRADVADDGYATSNVLVNLFMEAGMEQVIGEHGAFINVGRGFLTDTTPLPLPADRVVLEVLETVTPDPAVMEGLRRLTAQGFTIALDDFEFRDDLKPLMDFARIVKIDVWNKDADQVERDVARWSGRPGVKLLAEKVETRDEFHRYQAMGFDLFQGYFFARPENVTGRKAPGDRLTLLKLLAELRNPEADLDDLDRIVRRNATLSFKLLRYINSARFALRRRVESVREALTYLGLEAMRRWITIMAMDHDDSTPNALISTALVRARCCENLGRAVAADNPEIYFTVGLFSALDAILDMDMRTILAELPLEAEVNDALLNRTGPMGAALDCVIAYENADGGDRRFQELSTEQTSEAFLEALGWSYAVERDMGL
ncbi:MAG: EAL and HDOD domain-containing protein [Gammaproteobacteria bacterium]